MLRKSTYIVVRFNHSGFSTESAFYNVRINGPLCEEVYSTNLLGFFFEDTNEFFTDDLTFCFRFCYSG